MIAVKTRFSLYLTRHKMLKMILTIAPSLCSLFFFNSLTSSSHIGAEREDSGTVEIERRSHGRLL